MLLGTLEIWWSGPGESPGMSCEANISLPFFKPSLMQRKSLVLTDVCCKGQSVNSSYSYNKVLHIKFLFSVWFVKIFACSKMI